MHRKQNRRVDKCIVYLMRFARDMMFDRIIRMVKVTPTHRMQQITKSHHSSKEISDDTVETLDENTWLVKSATTGRGPYTVTVCLDSECLECPLSCPVCKVCVHQFTCTCIDHQIKGKFCKRVHACMRVTKREDLIPTGNEDEITSAFEKHSSQVVEAQERSVYVGLCVTQLTQCRAILNMIQNEADSTWEEALTEVVPALQRILDFMRRNSADVESDNVSPTFSKSPPNLPSYKNLEKQRFSSTQSRRKPTGHRFAKPTDMEKSSLKAAVNNPDFLSSVVHTNFDHTYEPEEN